MRLQGCRRHRLQRGATNAVMHLDTPSMTWRARAYLAIAVSAYCILLGLACLLTPERFGSPSFAVLQTKVPCGIEGWGYLHLAVGALGVYASLRGREGPARCALVAAAMLLAPWVQGLYIAWITLPAVPPTGVIAYGVLMATHLIQVADPLRSPFDDLLKAVRNEQK